MSQSAIIGFQQRLKTEGVMIMRRPHLQIPHAFSNSNLVYTTHLASTKRKHEGDKKSDNKKKSKYGGMREGVVYRLPKGSNKEFIVIVDGHPIRFGDPHMENHEDDSERRDNFRARHNCDEKNDRSTAGYWACKTWKSGFRAQSLPSGVEL